MRIAIVMASLGRGGVESVVLKLARNFTQARHHVEIITATHTEDGIQAAQTVCKVTSLRAKQWRPEFAILKSAGTIANYIASTNPDILLATPGYSCITAVASTWMSRRQRTIVAWTDCAASVYVRGKWYHALFLLLFCAFQSFFKVIVCSTDTVKEELQQLGLPKEKLVVIHNAILNNDYQVLALEPTNIAWIDERQFRFILAVGRLVPEKGFDNLLRSMAKLRLFGNDNVKLVILGTGPELEKLIALARNLGIEQHVFFLGHQQNPYAFYGRAAVFALSSNREAYGNVIVEAAALNLPVVATSGPRDGPAHLVRLLRHGVLVPIGNIDALALAINTLLNTASTANTIDAITYFDSEQCAAHYLSLFQQSLHSNYM